MKAWLHGPGGAALSRYQAAVRAVIASSGTGNLPAIGHACEHLASAIVSAQGAPPMPFRAAATWYSRALSEDERAVTDCQAGVQTSSVAAVSRAAGMLDIGNADIRHATAATRAFNSNN